MRHINGHEELHAPTQEQMHEWKQKYGGFYKITMEDGRVIWIFDPLSSLTIMKAAFAALNKTTYDYVRSVVENCWLMGDESVKNDEAALSGIEKEINDFTELPDCKVERVGDKYRITVEGMTCEVRGAKRQDIQWAEKRNAAKEPFETAVNLLSRISISGTEEIRKSSTRAYIGLLAGIDKVQEKIAARVEKY